ncbi:penicillin-binding protein activator [Marinobacterium weihaiense]|uniref:Penicillin-binding protein activator n=1 Tax=Marinobacterium weihaiense TaxID=2851016 RepID=A0ABS6MAW8_9GAMM|nr:penicillin-binding protein activator [Marinobacterium weihaiense]MBV0933385.1 penicillin-binding protein activator [Marinobacterium weihaiense]
MTNLHRLSFSLLLATALLTGCASQTTPPEVVDKTAGPAAGVDSLLRQADTQPATPAAELRLQAARQLAQRGENARALDVLDAIDVSRIPPTLAFEVAKLTAQLSQNEQDPATILRQLDPKRFDNLSAQQQATLGQLRADAWLQQDDPIGAVRELIVSSLLTLDPQEQQRYHNQIWQLLQNIPFDQIKAATRQDNDYQEQGWFELAAMLQERAGLAEREQALQKWGMMWQSHPALLLPPAGLVGIDRDGEQLRVQRIGVILPLSGELAKPAQTLRKGMEAALEVARRQGKSVPRLVLLDSTGLNDVAPLLMQARQQGVELLIGPLNPQLINQLAALQNLEIPVLALNASEPGPSQPWQLELSSEHEARMIVRRALSEGHRRVLLVTPGAEWGDRVASVMREELESAGGRVVGTLRYDTSGNYNEQIGNLMLTPQSAAREKQLRAVVRHRLEFQERRRKDADAILMTALPDAARLIKPMLDYHFAGDLPVYATSHLYEGHPDATRDVDLNGITFCDLPWLLQAPSEAQRLLSSNGENTLSRSGRLLALGVDSINVYPWLPQLERSSGTFLVGETGQLSMSAGKRLERTLSCTPFENGIPASLAQESSDNN